MRGNTCSFKRTDGGPGQTQPGRYEGKEAYVNLFGRKMRESTTGSEMTRSYLAIAGRGDTVLLQKFTERASLGARLTCGEGDVTAGLLQ